MERNCPLTDHDRIPLVLSLTENREDGNRER